METSGSINYNSPGFEELFKSCFQDYYESLHRYAYTIVRENEQAKDIVQAIFCKWWEKREVFKIEKSVKSYLFTAVYNQSINQLRNNKNRKTFTVDFGQNKFDIAEQDKEDMGDKKEIEMKLTTAIEALPPQCKLIFLKSRFERKKYIEIATELNLSIRTVEVQIGKALKILRSKMINHSRTTILFLLMNFIR